MSLRATLLLFASGLAFATAASAEVKDSSAAGFTVENKRVVPVAPDAAFRAAVDEVDRWWPKDHSWWGKDARFSIDAKAGGCFCERGGAREAMHMLVTFVDPPNLIRMTGGLGPLQGMGFQGALEFRFKALDDGNTEITLWYRAGGYTPDDISGLVKAVDQVQALQLGGLAEFLGAKKKGGEMSSVSHDGQARRFVVQADGVEAHLDYELAGKVMTITHTIVPPEIGGRGIAGQLVAAAFAAARAQGWRVVPQCSYAAAWAQKHPDVQDLLSR